MGMADVIWRDIEARRAAAWGAVDNDLSGAYSNGPAELSPPTAPLTRDEEMKILGHDPFDTGEDFSDTAHLRPKPGVDDPVGAAHPRARPPRGRVVRSLTGDGTVDRIPIIAPISPGVGPIKSFAERYPAPPQAPAENAGDDEKPTRGLRTTAVISAVALGLAVTAGLAVAGADETKGVNPAAVSAELPPNFACDVTGVSETPNNDGKIMLREPVPAGHQVYIGNAGRTVAGIPSATDPSTINFNAYGVHIGTIGVSVDQVACRGPVNLGKPGPGDENFVAG
jgi:hypothetical protein